MLSLTHHDRHRVPPLFLCPFTSSPLPPPPPPRPAAVVLCPLLSSPPPSARRVLSSRSLPSRSKSIRGGDQITLLPTFPSSSSIVPISLFSIPAGCCPCRRRRPRSAPCEDHPCAASCATYRLIRVPVAGKWIPTLPIPDIPDILLRHCPTPIVILAEEEMGRSSANGTTALSTEQI